MDIGQLRYFQMIVEHRSFTKAAKSCSVSQPALSQQIAKLEKELGQPLFERQGRVIRLTKAGQVLQTQAKRILQLVDEAKLRITDDGHTGEITISAIPSVASYLLPQVIDAVGSQFPQAKLVIREDEPDQLLRHCTSGEVDIGLVSLPASGKYLAFEPFFEEELMLALAADHTLVDAKQIRGTDLASERLILLNEADCVSEPVKRLGTRKNMRAIKTERVLQLSTIKQMVALGQCISFVPKGATSDNLNGRVVYRSLTGERPRRKIAICWNELRFQSQLIANFIKGLIEFSGSDFIASIEGPLLPTPSTLPASIRDTHVGLIEDTAEFSISNEQGVAEPNSEQRSKATKQASAAARSATVTKPAGTKAAQRPVASR